ncbi:hypothetical protein ACFWBH_01035 [Streptomyces sp. NPDC059999]
MSFLQICDGSAIMDQFCEADPDPVHERDSTMGSGGSSWRRVVMDL